MEYDYDKLMNDYAILLQVREYILTVDGVVLKKSSNGKYKETDINDEFAKEMLKLTKKEDTYVNRQPDIELD